MSIRGRRQYMQQTQEARFIYRPSYLMGGEGTWRDRDSREHKRVFALLLRQVQAREQAHYKPFKLARKLTNKGRSLKRLEGRKCK